MEMLIGLPNLKMIICVNLLICILIIPPKPRSFWGVVFFFCFCTFKTYVEVLFNKSLFHTLFHTIICLYIFSVILDVSLNTMPFICHLSFSFVFFSSFRMNMIFSSYLSSSKFCTCSSINGFGENVVVIRQRMIYITMITPSSERPMCFKQSSHVGFRIQIPVHFSISPFQVFPFSVKMCSFFFHMVQNIIVRIDLFLRKANRCNNRG